MVNHSKLWFASEEYDMPPLLVLNLSIFITIVARSGYEDVCLSTAQ